MKNFPIHREPGQFRSDFLLALIFAVPLWTALIAVLAMLFQLLGIHALHSLEFLSGSLITVFAATLFAFQGMARNQQAMPVLSDAGYQRMKMRARRLHATRSLDR